jgi:UDP-N-acetyl-D-mannosaminuronic acid transferase (WecB/TagA/CpsF family)
MRDFPDLELAGMWVPTRESLADPCDAARLAREVGAASPDIVLICLPKPLSEQWIESNCAEVDARVYLAFGAAADFVTGIVPRAPKLVQRVGCEWLFRLVLEPRRLARRYLIQGPRAFAFLLNRESTLPASTGSPPMVIDLVAAEKAAAERVAAAAMPPGPLIDGVSEAAG